MTVKLNELQPVGEVASNPVQSHATYTIVFVSGQSRGKVSAGFSNVRSLAVAAFDLVYCSLSVLRLVFVLDISKQSS